MSLLRSLFLTTLIVSAGSKGIEDTTDDAPVCPPGRDAFCSATTSTVVESSAPDTSTTNSIDAPNPTLIEAKTTPAPTLSPYNFFTNPKWTTAGTDFFAAKGFHTLRIISRRPVLDGNITLTPGQATTLGTDRVISIAPSNVLFDGSYWTLPSQTPSYTPSGPGSLFTVTDLWSSEVVFTAYNMPPATSADGVTTGLSRMVMAGRTFTRGGQWELVGEWWKGSLPVSGGMQTVAMVPSRTTTTEATTTSKTTVSWPTEARLVSQSARRTASSSATGWGRGEGLGCVKWRVGWISAGLCLLVLV